MKKLPIAARRWLISLHIVFISTFIGGVVINLLLGLTALTAGSPDVLEAAYISLKTISGLGVIYATAVGSLISGLLLSILTQWGLFRFYWLVVKEGLFAGLIVIQMLGNRIWIKGASQTVLAELAFEDAVVSADTRKLVIGLSMQLVSLAAMLVISYFKPWGKTRGRAKKIKQG